ncbi:MAG: tRNA uridine-5-carboxymethylaminomethyl(34) synthesis GTPase MnmE [Eubacterium sp.]|nr:tRNA uridine-5-carboxymethylaminomethyl(34) synthesis GTPase MnmE [Eubacterium sp.]
MDGQTIAAIATASANGSISILRVSGPEAVCVVDKLFYKKCSDSSLKTANLETAASHTIHYGFICTNTDAGDQPEIIDEVLILLMRAPKSYTAEDVVEIHCHGGAYIAKKNLDLLIENGIRLAEPGEFTKRAFLNGRIDLTQAESVMEIISAKSDIALKNAENHLAGDVKKLIISMRELLLTDTAYLEAALDDPEHIELDDFPATLNNHLNQIEPEIDRLISNSENGRIISDGIKTAIVGRPNVGKSSFLNCILRADRAIVTDIPGTTRDTLEEDVRIGSVLLKLIDTAGIRSTEDTIEKIGVEKTYASIEESDFTICILDSSEEITEKDIEILKLTEEKPGVILLNKSDLNEVTNIEKVKEIIQNNNINKNIINFSAATGEGLKTLETLLEETFFKEFYQEINTNNKEIYITNTRQKECLINAKNSITNLRRTMQQNLPEDLLTVDLLDVYKSLGLIVGEEVEDDLADKIFKDFCMGK